MARLYTYFCRKHGAVLTYRNSPPSECPDCKEEGHRQWKEDNEDAERAAELEVDTYTDERVMWAQLEVLSESLRMAEGSTYWRDVLRKLK